MGDVVELKTKKLIRKESYWDLCNPKTDSSMWERMYSDKTEESDMWYNKFLNLNQKVYRMSLWDRIFNWPY